MKNYYLLLFLFFGLFGKAQIINFSDANLKNILLEANVNNGIASTTFFDENEFYCKIDLNEDGEIQYSEALNIKTLNLINSNLTNINGLEFFTELKVLYISENNLNNLNILNSNLEYLICGNCNLNSFTIISSNSLKYLDASYNNLINLDLTSLQNLTFLNLSHNNLVNINVTSLNLLIELDLSNNNLTNLNLTNLNLLTDLNCSNNQITNFDLNNLINLERLICGKNLNQNLDCSNLFSLKHLICSNSLFLKYINIKNGVDNSGPFSCASVSIYDNGFTFNNCPELQYICLDNNEFNCVQSKIYNYGYQFQVNANSYCTFILGGQLNTIQGYNKLDNENDGCDIIDGFIPNLKYSITDGINSGSLISNSTGNYSIPVQSGSYTLTPIFENPSYFNVSPANVVVNFPTQTSPFTQNFCITPNGVIHDVEISIIPLNPARPGFDCNYQIIYKNKGNQTENGTINLAFDHTIFDFVSTSVTTSSQTFGNLNWNYSNLQPFETRSINVTLNLNSPMETPAVNGGDVVNFTATVTTPEEAPCSNNWLFTECDNIFNLNQTVVNSCDPNDKTCLQGNTISPERVGGFVHYMIRFENTGTFPAQNIVVKDMIDTAKFDVSSLIPLHASDDYITKITGNKVEFIFENINLPFDDANNDGYIAFKIKTLPSLVIGDTFSNSANIYFDYNFPIVTNTATTTIAALSNPSFEFANYFSLYPNPTSNELNINLKSAVEINSIQIYNTIGQLVTVQTGNVLKVDVSRLKTGNYFIKINANEGFSTSQFIKE